MSKLLFNLFLSVVFLSCQKNGEKTTLPIPQVSSFSFNSLTVNGQFSGFDYRGITPSPVIRITFTSALNASSVTESVSLTDKSNQQVHFGFALENHDSVLTIQPTAPLSFISKYSPLCGKSADFSIEYSCLSFLIIL